MTAQPSPGPATDAEASALVRRIDEAARHVDATAGGVRTAWRRWGEGPALVLLHGGSGSWTHWVRNIEFLARGFTVIAADLPGLGDSELPAEGYSAESLASILSGGIDRVLGPDAPFHLLGFSFGGIVGAHVAVLQRHRTASVTVIGSPIFGLGSTGPANQVEAVEPSLSFGEALPVHRRNLERLMLADPSRIDPLALRVHHDNLRRARLRSRKIARTDTLARALQRAPCPVHGVWGERDVTVHPDLESLREFVTALRPGGSFQVFAGVGHWLPYEAHEDFNAMVEQHLGAAVD